MCLENRFHSAVRTAFRRVSGFRIGQVTGDDLRALAFREQCRPADIHNIEEIHTALPSLIAVVRF